MSLTQQKAMGKIKSIYLIGIGGSGMGGIAEVLHNLGYKVSGSDLSQNAMTDYLQRLGVVVFNQHSAENLKNLDVDVVVASGAIAEDNPELQYAHQYHIPVIPRAQMLAELMRFKHGIAIAGSHGKTTTTSLVASIFAEAGLDPTFVIGGRLNSLGTNAKLGSGRFFIAEADESDASFLLLSPMVVVVTNIDSDHLATYGGDLANLQNAFLQFINRLPFYGTAIVCLEDEKIVQLLGQITRPLVTYGFSADCDYRAVNVTFGVTWSEFTVIPKNDVNRKFSVRLNIPGQHNILNALASIAVAYEEQVPAAAIQAALQKFQGVGRRLQNLGTIVIQNTQQKAITTQIIDDYGHHPREIDAVINTLRTSWPQKRLVLVFQPHRYTRTRDLFAQFAAVLARADHVIVLEIFAAGESHIPGADSLSLQQEICKSYSTQCSYATRADLEDVILSVLQDQDILLMQGAGDISKIANNFAFKYSLPINEKIRVD